MRELGGEEKGAERGLRWRLEKESDRMDVMEWDMRMRRGGKGIWRQIRCTLKGGFLFSFPFRILFRLCRIEFGSCLNAWRLPCEAESLGYHEQTEAMKGGSSSSTSAAMGSED
ncbi:hypothetical protein IE53DRAFT_193179 [Violaceomyces palustris]|uniref:Uncharacterized protein n=1 Tax=Violaceomyces palustris TaxID=1673888 RepID=A0ACD0P581_9BASI|nr:hypothetical protein IE53DRAFT_193179 [Violaceomyces palustris]